MTFCLPTIGYEFGECSLGLILVAGSDRGICAIALGDNQEFLLKDLLERFPSTQLANGIHPSLHLLTNVISFIEKPAIGLDFPLDIRGTAFQQDVWRALREIPVGATAHYSEIAQRIGAPKSVRAVAGACAANPIAVVIPCHRVIRKDGSLSGYYWGLHIKEELLRRERCQ